MLDYALLKVIWWALIGILLMGFAIFGGRDFGVGMLHLVLARKDEERRILLNSVGPTWEGNQVWFITAGGALFAAWPLVYAAAFSGLYLAMLAVLLGFIMRPPGFDYRSKLSSVVWRSTWDRILAGASFLPSLLFGVAFGNLFIGLPFEYDVDMRLLHTGSFFELLSPFSVMAGLVSVSMFALQGALFVQLKTEHPLSMRARKAVTVSALVFALSFFICGYMLRHMVGLHIDAILPVQDALHPMQKMVSEVPGGWVHNFHTVPWLWGVPLLTVLGILSALVSSICYRPLQGIWCSSVAMIGAIASAGIALFPFVFPSRTFINHSLTLWDATASHLTLY